MTEGNLVVVVDKNTTDQKRYASIKIAPVENDFLNYTVKLVQVYEGYVAPETPEDNTNVDFNTPIGDQTR